MEIDAELGVIFVVGGVGLNVEEEGVVLLFR
jgi:hypothetical protein